MSARVRVVEGGVEAPWWIRDLVGHASRNRLSTVGAALALTLALIALLGRAFAPHDPSALGPDVLASPSLAYFMGTDQFGRDVYSRWLHGGATSFSISVGSVTMACVAGTLIGLAAGYRHGSWIDAVLMRGIDAVLSIPLVVALIAVAGTIGTTVRSTELLLVVFLAIAFLPPFARIARAGALAEMQEDYIRALRVLGAGPGRILFINLLPNVAPSLVIQASFTLALAIGAEATVSFLGFGIQPPAASWGNLLVGSRDYILAGKWWLLAFPSATIVAAVLAFNLLGDGLRDVLDPRRHVRHV